jgi:outer membrane protein OmpA-like peptidoglycan-associated protein
MKTKLTIIFFLFFFVQSETFSQIKFSGVTDVFMETRELKVEFVRREVEITKKSVEKFSSPIIVSNEITNSQVYGNDRGITINLTSDNQTKKASSNQLVIDLTETKKEKDLATIEKETKIEAPVNSSDFIGAILFDNNSTKIKGKQLKEIKNLEEILSANPNKKLQIVAYSAFKSSVDGKDEIAKERAEKVYNYLVKSKNLEAARLVLKVEEQNFYNSSKEYSVNSEKQKEKSRSVNIFLESDSEDKIVDSRKIDIENKEIESPDNSASYKDGEIVGFIFFDENQKKIKQEYYSELFKLNTVIESMPDKQIIIVGHADTQGSEMQNVDIAKARSEAVLDFIVGIFEMDPNRFEVHYEGENNFIVPEGNNVNANSKIEMNRSVTIILKSLASESF